MKYNFKDKAKVAGMTAAEVGVVGGSIIVTAKFLDFNVLFKNQIAADPNYANKFHIKHQGLIKMGVGVLAAAHVDNPWLKLLFIGIAVEGFVREVRVLTTGSDGVAFFDKVGNSNSAENRAVDERLAEMAKNYKTEGIAQQYGTMTAGQNVMTLTESYNHTTAGIAQQYGTMTAGAAINDGILVQWKTAA